MSEKLLIIRDSIDQVFQSESFAIYEQLKSELEEDSQFIMYEYIVNNKHKFSTSVVDSAKLKYIYKQKNVKKYRIMLDDAFNQILKRYDSE